MAQDAYPTMQILTAWLVSTARSTASIRPSRDHAKSKMRSAVSWDGFGRATLERLFQTLDTPRRSSDHKRQWAAYDECTGSNPEGTPAVEILSVNKCFRAVAIGLMRKSGR
jgi:hypothetical protein